MRDRFHGKPVDSMEFSLAVTVVTGVMENGDTGRPVGDAGVEWIISGSSVTCGIRYSGVIALGGVQGSSLSGERGLVTVLPVTLAGLVLTRTVGGSVTAAITPDLAFFVDGLVPVEGVDDWLGRRL